MHLHKRRRGEGIGEALDHSLQPATLRDQVFTYNILTAPNDQLRKSSNAA
jgi:hypothetical protein